MVPAEAADMESGIKRATAINRINFFKVEDQIFLY
jgi:hypothetical protein